MPVGVVLPGGGMSIAEGVALAQRAEQAGASGVYVVEAWRSAFVPLAAIAAATERVTIGPYVLNAYGRTPWIAGLSALDLDDLSGGRVVIGVGSGNVFTNRVYQGVEPVRPLAKMNDYVEVIRRIVRAQPGAAVQFRGEVHSISDWVPQNPPTQEAIPVYLAAIFPKMRRVAGRVADGVALGALLSREFIDETVLPGVHEGAVEAGRDPVSLGVKMAIFASVSDDRDEADRAARTAIVNLFVPKPHKHYEQTLEEQGHGSALAKILARLADGDHAGAVDEVPQEVVDELTISGTPAQCRARIDAYQGVVDEVLLVNVGATRHRLDAATASDRQAIRASYDPVIQLAGQASVGAAVR